MPKAGLFVPESPSFSSGAFASASLAAGLSLLESLTLLQEPAFRWLFVCAVTADLAAASFFAFGAPFQIRAHRFSATEAGLAFGLLQGLTGIAGPTLGRCWWV